jgi:hypothetical protein
MTKEELIKLSRENLRKSKQGSLCECYDEAFIKGYELSEKRIADLEKENAELKGIKDVATLIRANNDTVITLMQLNNKLVSKEQQLTKAKKIIKEFMKYEINEYDGSLEIHFEELKKQAEQFLKDCE